MADETKLGVNITGDATSVEGASKKATKAVEAVGSEAKQLDAAFRRLKSSIDPTFAAQERYNKALADGQRLLAAGRISKQEYTAATRAAKAALDAEIQSINANSAAARAAATAKREASRAAAAQEKLDAQTAARAARQAAQEKAAAEKAAAREAAAAEREAKAQVKAAAREAAEVAKAEARSKAQVERQASREAAEAEKQAKAEARTAAREAASAAKAAAAEKRAADRSAASSAREAANETRNQARAERETANAVRELRGSIDPAFAAQERYNDTMRRATALLMENKLQQGEWTLIQKQAAAQMDVNVRSMGRMNSVYVQLGYQAQDVTASLASGINPLVVLAQQGGQTAAALSMMGGTVGRVASFFAGPWGAAIIGATMLLGMYIQRTKESEKATKDATNAEDLRKMKLEELTQALKDYNKEQREANLNNSAQKEQKVQGALTQLNEANRRVSDLQGKLGKAQAQLDGLINGPNAADAGSAIALMAGKVAALRKQLTEASADARTAEGSLSQARLGQIDQKAEANADERKAIQLRYEQEQTAIQRTYATRIAAANKIANVTDRQNARATIELETEDALTAAKKRQLDAEEALAKQKSDEKKAPAAARRAAREELKEQEDALKDKIAGYTADQAAAGEDYQEILRIQDIKLAAIKKFYGAESKEAKDALRERIQQEKQANAQLLQAQMEGIDARENALEASQSAKTDVAKIGVEAKGDRTSAAQGLGLIGNKTAIAQRAAQLQEMYQLEVDFENRIFNLKLNSLQERLALDNVPLKVRNQLNQEIETLEARHEQRMAVMAAQNSRETARISQEAAMESSNKWRTMASTISQSVSQTFQGLWTGMSTWQQGMYNLADQLVYKWVDAGAKMLEKWIIQQATKTAATATGQAVETGTVVAGEAAKTTATVAGTAARVGVTAAGTAATTGMTITGALASIGADAARAAAGAYAAIAGIPVVGPFLAPAAAGAALVAVMALGSKIASARGGQWQVPEDGQITELHRDEMVLPAWAARPLRANLSAPTSAGMIGRAALAGASARASSTADAGGSMRAGDIHQWHIHAMDSRSFQRFLEDNPRALETAMKRQMRNSLVGRS